MSSPSGTALCEPENPEVRLFGAWIKAFSQLPGYVAPPGLE
jgi:hypothetical protein